MISQSGTKEELELFDGFQEEIDTIGGEAILINPSNSSVTAQYAAIEKAIKMNPTGLAISASSSSSFHTLLSSLDSKTKVISFQSMLGENDRCIHLGSIDSNTIGNCMLEQAENTLDQGGEIAILSSTRQATDTQTIIRVIRKSLENDLYPNLKLIKTAYGDDDYDEAYHQTEELLEKYKDLKVILALSGEELRAASTCVTDQNLQTIVKVIGIGDPDSVTEYIGEHKACVCILYWNQKQMGQWAADILNGIVTEKIEIQSGETIQISGLGNYQIQQYYEQINQNVNSAFGSLQTPGELEDLGYEVFFESAPNIIK